TVCVVGKMRDLILQLSKSSIYSTKPISVAMIVIARQKICMAYGKSVFSARYTDRLSGANIYIRKNLTLAIISLPTK
ncbi:hypothetical protein P2R98_24720, partial [Escherichia coli]